MVQKRHTFLCRCGFCKQWPISIIFAVIIYVVCVSRSNKHIKRGGQELELAALQACAATLCCGVVYDPSGLNEKGYIYAWLYRLMTTRDELVMSVCLSLLITSCFVCLKPGTHCQQSWIQHGRLCWKSTVAETGNKSATFNFVAGFGNKSATMWIRRLVAVDFVADTFNLLPVCTGPNGYSYVLEYKLPSICVMQYLCASLIRDRSSKDTRHMQNVELCRC